MTEEKHSLNIEIKTGGAETQKTQKTFGDLLRWPMMFARNVAMHLAVAAWSFNQIRQAMGVFYDYWKSRQEEAHRAMEAYLRLQKQAVPGGAFGGPTPIQALTGDIAVAKLPEFAGLVSPTMVAKARIAAQKISVPAMGPEGWVKPVLRAQLAVGGEADASLIMKVAQPLTAMGYDKDDASAMAVSIVRNNPGETIEVLQGVSRQMGRAYFSLYKGQVGQFFYPFALAAGMGIPGVRAATIARAGMAAWQKQLGQPGVEARLERYLGADVFERGRVTNWPLLQRRLVEKYLGDPTQAERMFGPLIANQMGRGILGVLISTGATKEDIDRIINDPGVSEELKESLRENMLSADPGIRRAAEEVVSGLKPARAQADRKIMIDRARLATTAEETGGVLSEVAKLDQTRRSYLKQELTALRSQWQTAAKHRGRWFTGWWTTGTLHARAERMLEMSDAYGLTNEETAFWLLSEQYREAMTGTRALSETIQDVRAGYRGYVSDPTSVPDLLGIVLGGQQARISSLVGDVRGETGGNTNIIYNNGGRASDQAALRSAAMVTLGFGGALGVAAQEAVTLQPH